MFVFLLFEQKSDKQYVLVTGGAGFIGSHTCIELTEKGFTPVVVDNFYNSCEESIRRVGQIVGQEIKFYKCDLVTDTDLLMDICKEYVLNSLLCLFCETCRVRRLSWKENFYLVMLANLQSSILKFW